MGGKECRAVSLSSFHRLLSFRETVADVDHRFDIDLKGSEFVKLKILKTSVRNSRLVVSVRRKRLFRIRSTCLKFGPRWSSRTLTTRRKLALRSKSAAQAPVSMRKRPEALRNHAETARNLLKTRAGSCKQRASP
jgi:hypothetical protein